MAKLKTPLLSLNARGTLAKILSFRLRDKQTIIEKKPLPKDAKSFSQLSWRHMYQKATALWNALSEDEKKTWEANATPRHMTGYAWFMSQCLKPNPGIYLPLQGGIMSGDIDMNSHDILRLGTVSAHKSGTINIGANQYRTTSMMLRETDPNTLALRNTANTDYRYLSVRGLNFYLALTARANALELRANNTNNHYLALTARQAGVGQLEVSRLQGATIPYMLLTRAKFPATPHAADVNHRGMFYYTEGGAGVADALYCIMKGADNNYSAVQVAIG